MSTTDPAPVPPLPLNTVARGFWDRHAARLLGAGLLTDADLDAFAVGCLTFSKLAALSGAEPGPDQYREMIQLDRLTKQFGEFCKQFGLTPLSRKRGKLGTGTAPKKKDEFEL